jgi:hypothetical protein
MSDCLSRHPLLCPETYTTVQNLAVACVRRFQFRLAPDMIAWECNCSICSMKKNVHVVVPMQNFDLLDGQDLIQEYRFGSKTAKHMHCQYVPAGSVRAEMGAGDWGM